jgi:hypothetical protein
LVHRLHLLRADVKVDGSSGIILLLVLLLLCKHYPELP